MPNAAAFDDLTYGQTPRRGAARKPRGAPATSRKKKGKRPRIDLNRVARLTAIGMAATMAIGIMVNALMLQKGRHPSPLFGKTDVTMTPIVPKAPATGHAAARNDVVDDPADKDAGPAPKPRRTADAAPSDDAIARLLVGGGTGAAPKTDKTETGDSRTITAVQRALTKLGFKVPTTGTAGQATRKAIEAFEREHHLPVKGEIDRRLVKALATEAKTKID